MRVLSAGVAVRQCGSVLTGEPIPVRAASGCGWPPRVAVLLLPTAECQTQRLWQERHAVRRIQWLAHYPSLPLFTAFQASPSHQRTTQCNTLMLGSPSVPTAESLPDAPSPPGAQAAPALPGCVGGLPGPQPAACPGESSVSRVVPRELAGVPIEAGLIWGRRGIPWGLCKPTGAGI
jgi:hypothetical protein